MKIAMLGSGAWGTALATLLAHNGHEVLMWAYESEVANDINQFHENKHYLPGITLDKKISATSDISQAICGTQWIFEAIPVEFLRKALEQTVHCFSKEQIWVITSKGIEQNTLMLPSQIIDDVFGYKTKQAVIAGPSFAYDLARKDITGVAVAAQDCAVADALQELMANLYFRPYVNLDMVGVQLAAALKNVITLGVGMLDGAGFADNAKAFLFTRGLHEMVQLGIAMGAQKDTFYGLAGVGDLVLTAMGKRSRNLQVGRYLGIGKTLDHILQTTGYIPEGINTVQSLHQLMHKKQIAMPVCDGIYKVIFGSITLHDMLADLMSISFETKKCCS
jgi:glycerol-3-phosphate dehydrogenase (NAD(P)+)